MNPVLLTLHPKPLTLNPKPQTPNIKPKTLPQTGAGTRHGGGCSGVHFSPRLYLQTPSPEPESFQAFKPFFLAPRTLKPDTKTQNHLKSKSENLKPKTENITP